FSRYSIAALCQPGAFQGSRNLSRASSASKPLTMSTGQATVMGAAAFIVVASKSDFVVEIVGAALLRLRGVGILRLDGERHVFRAGLFARVDPGRNPEFFAVHIKRATIVRLLVRGFVGAFEKCTAVFIIVFHVVLLVMIGSAVAPAEPI